VKSTEPAGRDWTRFGPAIAAGFLLAYLIVVPLALMAISSFRPGGFPLDPGWTFANYETVYGAANFPRLVRTTIAFAVGSTLMALTLGIALAWLIERTDLPLRGALRAAVILPMATPPILLAIGWAMLLSPRTGFFNLLLRDWFGLSASPFNVFSLGGMIFVEGLALVPTTFLFLSPAFRNMDPSLEEAAATSGAGPFTMLRRVILPLLWPSILAAGIFLTIVCLVVFDIPGTLGMPARIYVLSTQIYYLAVDSPTGVPLYGQVSALAVFFLVMLALLGWAYHRLTRHAQRFRTVTGKGFRPRLLRLGRWRWVAFAGVVLYFMLAVVAPLAILTWTSLMPYQTRVTWAAVELITLDNHRDFFANRRVLTATANSLTIALVSATAVALLSVGLAWLVARARAPGAKFLDGLAFAPMAMPGVMLGVALVYVYLTLDFGFAIYGTIWIIAIAYVTHYLSFGTRLANGVLIQLHPELEEAGAASGASTWRILRKITVPLIWPAVVGIWIWVVAHALRELSTALMLQGRENVVVPTLLWDYWSGGEPNRAAAVGVWLVIALVVFLSLWQAFARGRLERST
jgi:iron(III) transport system permease protein